MISKAFSLNGSSGVRKAFRRWRYDTKVEKRGANVEKTAKVPPHEATSPAVEPEAEQEECSKENKQKGKSLKTSDLPDLPLQSRPDYLSWKEKVMEAASKAEVLPLLVKGLPIEEEDQKPTRGIEKAQEDDAILRRWVLQLLPGYLRDLLASRSSSFQLWVDIEREITSCSFQTGSATLQQIQCSATFGCHSCGRVLRVLRTLQSKYTDLRPTRHSQDIRISQNGSRITVSRQVSRKEVKELERYCLSGFPVQTGHEASQYLDAPFTLTLWRAAHWLETCVRQHPHCAISNPMFMPRRVIHVGDANTQPFLTESHPDCSPYVALSYCWGSTKDTLVTTQHNLYQHLEAINFEKLPKSIKDAVIVCRFLDIKYLWVDGLCIIQDDIDERDWYEQSSQMGAVYSNAHFVISADAASCCTDGFLENHDQYNTWTPVSYSAADGVEVVELGCQSFKVPRVRGCAGNIQASALSRRGWAMQECILPHRILHFVGDEIVWECNTTCTCECNKTYLHGLWKHADFTLVNDPRLQQEDEYANVHIDDFLRGRTTESGCWIWERLIERYSHRALTVSGDKLAAISGLTTLFQKYLEVELADYLAGIWKVDLPAGLLWYMSGSPAPSKPDRWRAPSWSWASMNGGIGFFNERYQFTFTPRITIIESVCKASPIDPLGKVSDGLIRLRGTLEPVTLTVTHFKRKDLYNGQYQGSCGKPGRAYPDLMARVCKYGSPYEILPDMRIEAGTYFEKYYCLDIGRASNPLRLGKRTSWLVLRKTGDERGGIPCFERVGIGIFDSSSRGVSFFPASGHRGTELILV